MATHNLLSVTSWQMATAVYGGAWLLGALLAGIVVGLDHLASKHNTKH